MSFRTEVKRDLVRVARPDVAVGIDLGVKHLAVMADSMGEIRYEPNPKYLDGSLKLLRRHSRRVSRRQGPDRRTGRKPSKRWEKANAERNRVHHRVANQRSDALHQLTTRIRAEYGTVVVEAIVADRWYPSSKTCSNCGAVTAKLPLHVRVFDCDECRLVMDRDENAAHNLVALVAAATTAGAGGWRNPAAPAAGRSERPYSSRSPYALVM
ncbi:transposase [Streptomyces sp. NPDC020192]|uniref:transposase n=1 Tax=Streptomyces sp. NPDC020192 TaxID=3365066 RepID=UPI0037AF3BA1